MKRTAGVLHKSLDAENKKLCCRDDFTNQETAATNPLFGPGSTNVALPNIDIKKEVSDSGVEFLAIKEEPVEWGSQTQTPKDTKVDVSVAVLEASRCKNDFSEKSTTDNSTPGSSSTDVASSYIDPKKEVSDSSEFLDIKEEPVDWAPQTQCRSEESEVGYCSTQLLMAYKQGEMNSRDKALLAVALNKMKGEKKEALPPVESASAKVDECRKRWKNIKDTNSKKKIRKTGSAAPPASKRGKVWALEEKLLFLQSAEEHRESFSTIDAAQHEEAIADEGEAGASALLDTKRFEQKSAEPSRSSSSSTPMCSKSITFKHASNSIEGATSKTLRKTSDRGKFLASFEKRSVERHNLIKNLLSSEESLDDIDLFFQSLSKSAKKLSLQGQITAKIECMKTICRLQEEEIHASNPLAYFGYSKSTNATPSPTVIIESHTQCTSANAHNSHQQQFQPSFGEANSSTPINYSINPEEYF